MPAKISQPMKRLKQAYRIIFVSLLNLFFIGLLCFGSSLSAETTQLGNKKWEKQDLEDDKSLTGISKFDDQFVGVGDNDSLITLSTESPEEYIIEVSADPKEGGNVTGGGTYAEDERFTVIAIPNEGYYFKNWLSCSQDPLGMPMVCSEVSRDAEFTFIASFFGQTNFKAIFNLYGDANFDEVIDVQDVLLVMKHVLEIEILDEVQKKAADVNSDDLINVQDVTLIMQKALGKIDKFPVKTGLDFERPDLDDLPYEVKAWVDDVKKGKAHSHTYEYNNNLYIMAVYEAPHIAYEMTITQLTERDEKLYVLVYINEPIGFCLPELDYQYNYIVMENLSIPVEFKVFSFL